MTLLQKLNRDAVTAIMVAEMLVQGLLFDSRSAYGLPVNKKMVTRALRALIVAGVVSKSKTRTKYILTDDFLEAVRQAITKGMPRGTFVHYPDLSVFDMCGVGNWTVEELETYVTKLRQRWKLRNSAP